jgi:hypothetical protein
MSHLKDADDERTRKVLEDHRAHFQKQVVQKLRLALRAYESRADSYKRALDALGGTTPEASQPRDGENADEIARAVDTLRRFVHTTANHKSIATAVVSNGTLRALFKALDLQRERADKAEAFLTKCHAAIGARDSHGPEGDAACIIDTIHSLKESARENSLAEDAATERADKAEQERDALAAKLQGAATTTKQHVRYELQPCRGGCGELEDPRFGGYCDGCAS